MDPVNSAVLPVDQLPGSLLTDIDPSLVEVARRAAIDEAGSGALVGDHLGSNAEDAVAVTVRFATTDPAYVGWSWCVTVAAVEPSAPTISEVVLLPGPASLLAPAWLPWSERIRPGDLGPGDLLLPAPEDPRLVPAYVASDDPAVEELASEIGLGRVRVLSRLGRIEAAERWHEGGFGPDSEMAKAAPATCDWCAFYLPLAGSLGAGFGACSNELSPADGRVVDAAYGCGAHSEFVVELPPTGGAGDTRLDELVLDFHLRPAVAPELGARLHQAAELIEEEVDAGEVPGAAEPDVAAPEAVAEPAEPGEPAADVVAEVPALEAPEPEAAEPEAAEDTQPDAADQYDA